MAYEKKIEVIVEVVRMLGEVWKTDITEQLLASYTIALSDVEPAAIQQAAGKALRECKFMPKPAELRGFAGKTDGYISLDAWQKVVKAVRDHGSYQAFNFDPITNATVREMGGMSEIGRATIYDIEKKKNQFVEIWLKKKTLGGDLKPEECVFLPGVLSSVKPINIATSYKPAKLPLLAERNKHE